MIFACSVALRTGSRVSEAVLWQNFMTNEEALRICLLLLQVAPPLFFTVTLFTDTPTNNLAAPSPSLRYIVAINVICGICASKISRLFLHQDILFPLVQLFIRGTSRYRFPKRWNWQICHAHRAFKLPLRTFCGKLRTFPTVKSKTFEFLHRAQKKSTLQFLRIPNDLLPEKELPSGHYGAYSRAAGTCYPT